MQNNSNCDLDMSKELIFILKYVKKEYLKNFKLLK